MDGTRDNDPLKVLETLVVLAVATVAGTIFGTGSIPGVNAEVCATGSGDEPAFQRVDGEVTGPVDLPTG